MTLLRRLGSVSAAALLSLPLIAACGAPTEETGPTAPSQPRMLLADCAPSETGLTCRARVIGGTSQTRDVTDAATWSASPAGSVRVDRPGVLFALAGGDVTVRVDYEGLTNSNPLAFRLAPGAAPQTLTFVGVSAIDASRTVVPRARVEIVAGTGNGMSCVTNEGGYCSLRGILVGEPLRLRVTADGFAPAEREHRVDPFPGTPFVTVELSRLGS